MINFYDLLYNIYDLLFNINDNLQVNTCISECVKKFIYFIKLNLVLYLKN